MKKLFLLIALILPAFFFVQPASAAVPNWNITGTWNARHYYGGHFYTHVNNVTETVDGTLTGNGGWNGYVDGNPTGASNIWYITTIPPYESHVSGNTFHMSYHYSY